MFKKLPNDSFNIINFINFTSGNTPLGTSNKLQHNRNPTSVLTSNFYFNQLPQIWNTLPIINCDLSIITIKKKLTNYLWNHFETNFDSNNACTYLFLCLCSHCNKSPNHLILKHCSSCNNNHFCNIRNFFPN